MKNVKYITRPAVSYTNVLCEGPAIHRCGVKYGENSRQYALLRYWLMPTGDIIYIINKVSQDGVPLAEIESDHFAFGMDIHREIKPEIKNNKICFIF